MTIIKRKPDNGSPCGTPVKIGKNLLSLFFPVIIQLLRFASQFSMISMNSNVQKKFLNILIKSLKKSILDLPELHISGVHSRISGVPNLISGF